MTSLTELLLATQNPALNANAEAQIRKAEQDSVEGYFTALAQELASDDKPKIARQLSGLLLKNGLSAKDPSRDRELKARWASLSDPTRTIVKEATVKGLTAGEVDVGKAAAQVLAKIGAIEIPTNVWPDLLPLLLGHVTQGIASRKQIAAVTLGYLCEELVMIQEVMPQEQAKIDDTMANQILTAVVQGMRDPEVPTKLEATRAFYHAVVLAQKNFSKPHERDFMMSVIVDTCRFQGSESVQIAAFECLVQIATEYYDYLLPYMHLLGPMTWDTIKMATEKVAIPAMEFWSSVCDEELYLMDAIASDGAGGRKPLNVIQQALPHLVPLLCETLTRQENELDDDTWNLAMAAGTCLQLVAQVVSDACVEQVLAFVQSNFENQDWKFREAAVLAYGSIMEGPTSEKMRPLVQQSYPHLVNHLADKSERVRDTVAWTIGQIAKFHPTIVPVQSLLPILVEKLMDVPRVASNVCFVIQVLAEAPPVGLEGPQGPASTPLSTFFTSLAQRLLQVVARPDADDRKLWKAAYATLGTLITRSGADCMGHMDVLMKEMLSHLSNSFKATQTVSRECELQGSICLVLEALVRRMRERMMPYADQVMEGAIQVISAYQQVKCGAQVLHEEALMLVAAVAGGVGNGFDRFMPHFWPHFKNGLENYEDVTVCNMSTAIVGDLCRALDGKQLLPYCDRIMETLYQNLQNKNCDRKIKATIMVCFGDIALSVQEHFLKYLKLVIDMLVEASSTRYEHGENGEEWREYLNNLREGVLTAYTGIIHGLRDAKMLHVFKENVAAVIQFVQVITEDPTVSEEVLKAATGVIGDLVMSFQTELIGHIGNAPFLKKLVEFGFRSSDPNIRQTASWLQSLCQKYSAPALQQ